MLGPLTNKLNRATGTTKAQLAQLDLDAKYATELVKPGTMAPDFKLKTPQGKTLKLSKVMKGKYTLIFMDVQMPEMNGLDATRAIRRMEDPWASSIPIIAMTADAFSENVTECLNAGMNGHIAKPFDVKLVIKEIRKIKERRS